MNSYNCCDGKTAENKNILAQLSLLKLLAVKNRLQIICVLNSEGHSVNDLVEHLGASQSLVSHHLTHLRNLDLVTMQKSGRLVIYSLSYKGRTVIKLLRLLSTKEQS